MAFTLSPLPYASDALEPHIDARTMEIHHDKHHATYVTNLNKALEGAPELAGKSLEALLANNLAAIPDALKPAVRTTLAASGITTCFAAHVEDWRRRSGRKCGQSHRGKVRQFR